LYRKFAVINGIVIPTRRSGSTSAVDTGLRRHDEEEIAAAKSNELTIRQASADFEW
jgi:hypothetical protein